MNIDKKAPAKLLSHEFECYLIVFEKPCFKSSHPFVIYKNQSVDIQSNMKIAPWSFGILPQEHLWNISCQHSWHLLLMLFHPNLAHRHMIYWNLFKNWYEIIQKFVWKSIWNYWGASLKYFLSTQLTPFVNVVSCAISFTGISSKIAMKLLTWLFHIDVKFCNCYNLIQRETTLLNEIAFDTETISNTLKTNTLQIFPI